VQDFLKSLYHLDPNYSVVKKYVGADGREVIFGLNKKTNASEQINSELYRGTYNYAVADEKNVLGLGAHYTYDMEPFNRKYPEASVVKTLLNNAKYDVRANAEFMLRNAYEPYTYFATPTYGMNTMGGW
jgi:hypothetical protein